MLDSNLQTLLANFSLYVVSLLSHLFDLAVLIDHVSIEANLVLSIDHIKETSVKRSISPDDLSPDFKNSTEVLYLIKPKVGDIEFFVTVIEVDELGLYQNLIAIWAAWMNIHNVT